MAVCASCLVGSSSTSISSPVKLKLNDMTVERYTRLSRSGPVYTKNFLSCLALSRGVLMKALAADNVINEALLPPPPLSYPPSESQPSTKIQLPVKIAPSTSCLEDRKVVSDDLQTREIMEKIQMGPKDERKLSCHLAQMVDESVARVRREVSRLRLNWSKPRKADHMIMLMDCIT